jgi:hypothetical protein
MKLFLPGSLWLLLIGLLVPAPASRGEPSDKLFDVYALIQQADRAEAHNDFNTASNKYRAALSLLYDIKYESPGWNPTVVEFRIKNCLEHYKALRAKRGLPSLPALETATKPATPPPPPVAAPVAVPPAPPPGVTAPQPPPAGAP